MVCLNTSSSEYQTKLKLSGIPEVLFKAFCTDFVSEYDRFPNLDELPGADSTKAVQEYLQVNKNNATDVASILQTTGTLSIEEANVKLNKNFTDKEITLLPLMDRAIVKIKDRPSRFDLTLNPDFQEITDVNAAAFLSTQLTRMALLYGILFITVTSQDVIAMGLPSQAKAFVKDGNIYINTDLADVDAPIHELMHIFLGSMRFTNPDTYVEIVSSMEPYTELYRTLYPNRTHTDLLEEVFVDLMGRLLAGNSNLFTGTSNKVLYEMLYNIQRVLDTMLMGNVSVAKVGDSLAGFSLKDLANMVQSSTMQNTFLGRLDLAAVHRITANLKSELMQKGELKEECA